LQGESMEPDITSRILRCSAVEKGRSKIRQISYPKNKLPTSPHRLEAPSASWESSSREQYSPGCFKA
jgi:hypothetical protein